MTLVMPSILSLLELQFHNKNIPILFDRNPCEIIKVLVLFRDRMILMNCLFSLNLTNSHPAVKNFLHFEYNGWFSHMYGRVGGWTFHPPLIKPCMRFSLTRLSDILLSTALRHAVAILFKPFSYKVLLTYPTFDIWLRLWCFLLYHLVKVHIMYQSSACIHLPLVFVV